MFTERVSGLAESGSDFGIKNSRSQNYKNKNLSPMCPFIPYKLYKIKFEFKIRENVIFDVTAFDLPELKKSSNFDSRMKFDL